jgi:glutaredoxin
MEKKKSRIKHVTEKTKNTLKEFFSKKFNVYLTIFLLLLGLVSFYFTSDFTQPAVPIGETTVHFFFLPTCPHCTEQKPIYYELKAERTDVQFFEHDASSTEGSQLFHQKAKEAGLDTSRLGVPTIFVGEHALVGLQTKEKINETLNTCINECKGKEPEKEQVFQQVETGFKDYELPFLGRTDLTKWSLPSLAIILGMIDGFNPCAMWVLIYLIGLLIEVRDKRKVWLIVGSFLFASGTLYFLFMTAWINVFLLLGYIQVLTILIGLVALGGGILSIKDYVETKGAMVCKVESPEGQKKMMSRVKTIVSEPITWGLVASIVGLAFIVNSVEFACSAAIPAVFTQILALSNISVLQNYLYIGLYTLFFMLDDLIIFGMAAFAIGSSFGEKYSKFCKLFGGIIMLVLGLIMLFAPNLLG